MKREDKYTYIIIGALISLLLIKTVLAYRDYIYVNSISATLPDISKPTEKDRSSVRNDDSLDISNIDTDLPLKFNSVVHIAEDKLSTDLFLKNCSCNIYPIQAYIVEPFTKEVIYTSPLLDSGEYIENIKLDAKIKDNNYYDVYMYLYDYENTGKIELRLKSFILSQLVFID